MKRKLSFLFLSALTIPFLMVSCSDDKEEQEVKPAAGFVADYIRGDVVSLLEWLMPMFLILLEMTIFLAVMLPVSLKYGIDRKSVV